MIGLLFSARNSELYILHELYFSIRNVSNESLEKAWFIRDNKSIKLVRCSLLRGKNFDNYVIALYYTETIGKFIDHCFHRILIRTISSFQALRKMLSASMIKSRLQNRIESSCSDVSDVTKYIC